MPSSVYVTLPGLLETADKACLPEHESTPSCGHFPPLPTGRRSLLDPSEDDAPPPPTPNQSLNCPGPLRPHVHRLKNPSLQVALLLTHSIISLPLSLSFLSGKREGGGVTSAF